MKKILSIFLISISSLSFALDGYSQARMEKIYDTYRAKIIDGRPATEQALKMQKIQKALRLYTNSTRITENTKAMFAYLGHLFCEAESIVDGNICQDGYTPKGLLTYQKNTLTLDTIRSLLIAEHSKRRTDRGLSPLTESSTLDSIAQNYALALCKAGYITHELGGSTLEQRFRDGGYVYTIGGENLGSGQTTITQILDQLITSIHHRENMFEPDFREIGVGQCDNIWVLNYGTRQ